jgi:hypothetical protein
VGSLLQATQSGGSAIRSFIHVPCPILFALFYLPLAFFAKIGENKQEDRLWGVSGFESWAEASMTSG